MPVEADSCICHNCRDSAARGERDPTNFHPIGGPSCQTRTISCYVRSQNAVSMHAGVRKWGAQATNLGLVTCVLYTTGLYIRQQILARTNQTVLFAPVPSVHPGTVL